MFSTAFKIQSIVRTGPNPWDSFCFSCKVITRSRELLEAANEQKRKCEESVVERQQQLNKSEKTVKSISDELIKVL